MLHEPQWGWDKEIMDPFSSVQYERTKHIDDPGVGSRVIPAHPGVFDLALYIEENA